MDVDVLAKRNQINLRQPSKIESINIKQPQLEIKGISGILERTKKYFMSKIGLTMPILGISDNSYNELKVYKQPITNHKLVSPIIQPSMQYKIRQFSK